MYMTTWTKELRRPITTPCSPARQDLEGVWELGVLTWEKLQVGPGEEHSAGMVVDVEESHLRLFFSEDEEYSVQELDHFREEVPPSTVRQLKEDKSEKMWIWWYQTSTATWNS